MGNWSIVQNLYTFTSDCPVHTRTKWQYCLSFEYVQAARQHFAAKIDQLSGSTEDMSPFPRRPARHFEQGLRLRETMPQDRRTAAPDKQIRHANLVGVACDWHCGHNP